MNFFKQFLKKKKLPSNGCTVVTGGHLQFTSDIVSKLSTQSPNSKFLVLHNEAHATISESLNSNSNVQLFNCDVRKKDDLEEFSYYLQSDKDIKVNYYV